MHRTWFVQTACFAALTMSVGCANTSALETEMSRLRRELHFVRQDMAKQKRVVEELERRVTLVSLGKGAGPTTRATVPGSTSSRLDDRAPPGPVSMVQPRVPQDNDVPAADVSTARPTPSVPRRRTLPVVRLGANAQPKPAGQQEEWVDPGAQDDGGPPLRFTMAGEDGEEGDGRLPVDRKVLSQPDPVLDPDRPRPKDAAPTPELPPRRRRPNRAEVRAEYKVALDLLRENKEPQKALERFDKFLVAHPKSRLADNAAYWRGECLFALVKHEEAIVAFNQVVQRYPRSSKVPFALLRKGESYLALKRNAEAIESFKLVLKDHASSEAAESAKRLLKQSTTGK